MEKFELPAITKEMNYERIEKKIQDYFEDEINKFFVRCAKSPCCKAERNISVFVDDLETYPEDRASQFIDNMVDTILTLNYEHHGQVTITKSKRMNVLWGLRDKPAYLVNFVYTPQFMKK